MFPCFFLLLNRRGFSFNKKVELCFLNIIIQPLTRFFLFSLLFLSSLFIQLLLIFNIFLIFPPVIFQFFHCEEMLIKMFFSFFTGSYFFFSFLFCNSLEIFLFDLFIQVWSFLPLPILRGHSCDGCLWGSFTSLLILLLSLTIHCQSSLFPGLLSFFPFLCLDFEKPFPLFFHSFFQLFFIFQCFNEALLKSLIL